MDNVSKFLTLFSDFELVVTEKRKTTPKKSPSSFTCNGRLCESGFTKRVKEVTTRI